MPIVNTYIPDEVYEKFKQYVRSIRAERSAGYVKKSDFRATDAQKQKYTQLAKRKGAEAADAYLEECRAEFEKQAAETKLHARPRISDMLSKLIEAALLEELNKNGFT